MMLRDLRVPTADCGRKQHSIVMIIMIFLLPRLLLELPDSGGWMRICVDGEECVGHGRCYTVSPDVFEPDDEGFCAGQGLVREIPADREAAAAAGAQACPAGAITVLED
jgi:ferredoxin